MLPKIQKSVLPIARFSPRRGEKWKAIERGFDWFDDHLLHRMIAVFPGFY